MKTLSASEALWPALKRMYRFLFRPFDWEGFLKLAGVAVITEGVWVSFRFSLSPALEFQVPTLDKETLFAPEYITFTILGAFIAIFALFFSYYLVILLRFVFIHCLVYETRQMQPAWDRYQAPAWRFFKASLLVWVVLLGMAVLGVVAIFIAGLTLFNLRTPEGKLDLGVFFFLCVPCLAIVLLLLVAVVTAHVVMHDFILPSMALENLSFRKAWRVARQRINTNRETFFSYFILRLGLPLLAGFFLAGIAWAVNWAVFGVLGISAQGFDAMLDDATGVGAYFRVGFEVLFRLMGLGMGLFMAFTLGGPLATWVRSYSLLFWGGHYRALGDALNPPPALPAAVQGLPKAG
jgi:hypothetical protein